MSIFIWTEKLFSNVPYIVCGIAQIEIISLVSLSVKNINIQVCSLMLLAVWTFEGKMGLGLGAFEVMIMVGENYVVWQDTYVEW